MILIGIGLFVLAFVFLVYAPLCVSGDIRKVERPWWLPEGVEPKNIILAQHDGWKFQGSETECSFSPVRVHDPVLIWRDCLSNETVVRVANALAQGDMETIYELKPAHVRYQEDLDENGACHCVVCRSEYETQDS